jgi:hypothetical protein
MNKETCLARHDLKGTMKRLALKTLTSALLLSALCSISASAQETRGSDKFGCAGFNDAGRAGSLLSRGEVDAFMIGVIMGMARIPDDAMKKQDQEAALKHIHDFCLANPDRSALEGAREFVRGWKRSGQ